MTARDYTREPLMTPERIRYNTAHRAKQQAQKDYNETRLAARLAAEKYRATIAEEFAALKALQESLPHAHTDKP